MVSPLARLTIVLDLIRWQHTVFALPMALASAVLAIDASPPRSAGWWTWKILLIVLAAFAARSAAMAHNRWADRDIDATNPRTASRPSVTGAVSPGFLLGFTVAACLVFVLISGLINTLALALSPLFLTVLLGYSHAKRFTALAHIWLGVALGLAPVGAWVAITGSLAWTPLLMGLAVVPWVAGFDILYALADIEHDRREGLHSIPARLGARRAMALAAVLHVLSVMLLLILGLVAQRGLWYTIGVLAAGALLVLEHRLVRPEDLSRLPSAFLTLNGLFSLAILAGVVLDVWSRGT
ncbi:MAG: UbiA family prenyltransferase [Candidatus Sumerlaeia bacterium]|nr:UbiA family prenyltransferase [Candidatus Sumerlaeia bacterium]